MTDVDVATAAAVKVARSCGVDVTGTRLIGGYANILVLLEPHDVVARVSGTSGAVRDGFDWMAREVDVARHLAEVGAQAVRPSTLLPPGPHPSGDVAITYWDYLRLADRQPTPVEAGEALAALHYGLAGYQGDLRFLGPLFEGLAILRRPELVGLLGGQARSLVERRNARIAQAVAELPREGRPLHGDPHYGNLLMTTEGAVWGDFEDVCTGPAEWDAACLIASSRVLGNGHAAEACLQAYGMALDGALLDLFVEARTLQGLAWALLGIEAASEHPRVKRRLEWLAQRERC